MIFDHLTEEIRKKGNPTCAGLDTHLGCLPAAFAASYDTGTFAGAAEAILAYNRDLLDALADVVPAVKVQVAYYEQYGTPGMEAFAHTLRLARQAGLIVIADAKRNDIASTAAAYATAFLGQTKLSGGTQGAFDADIVTVNPYLGTDGIKPFLQVNPERGIFALVKTSNPSSHELQDLALADGRTVFEAVGDLVEQWGRGTEGSAGYSRVGAVVGATHPAQGAALRQRLQHTFFLLPGYGAQGATGADIAGMFDAQGGGAVVNASRSLLQAWEKSDKDHKTAARDAALSMRNDINAALYSK